MSESLDKGSRPVRRILEEVETGFGPIPTRPFHTTKVLKRSPKAAILRHAMDDNQHPPRSIVEKVFSQRGMPLECKLYERAGVRAGGLWRMPSFYGIRKSGSSYSLYLEDAEGGGYGKFQQTKPAYLGAAAAIGEMNRLFYGEERFRRIVSSSRSLEGFWRLKKDQCIKFPEYIDRGLAKKAMDAFLTAKSIIQVAEVSGLMRFVFSHGDLNRSNIFQSKDGEHFLFIDWESAKFMPFGGDLSQLLYSGWWGFLPSGKRKPPRDVNEICEIEGDVVNAYHAQVAECGVGLDDCALGLDMVAVKAQFLQRLPFALSVMTRPKNTEERAHLSLFERNLSFMLKKVDVLEYKIGKGKRVAS